MTAEKYSHCTHEDKTEPSSYFIIDYGTISMQDANHIPSDNTSAVRKEELRLALELAQELSDDVAQLSVCVPYAMIICFWESSYALLWNEGLLVLNAVSPLLREEEQSLHHLSSIYCLSFHQSLLMMFH